MSRRCRGLRLTVYLDEDVLWQHRPIYVEIVMRAKQAGMAGATVHRGLEGFGGSREIHTRRLLSFAEHLPMVVTIVDEEPRVREFLPQLDELIEKGVSVLDEVEMVRYGV